MTVRYAKRLGKKVIFLDSVSLTVIREQSE